jgi:Uncharacterized protein conserved in bacteria
MNDVNERFWNAPFEQLLQGYAEEEERFSCLLCGRSVDKGVIYPVDGMLYEAGRYIRLHIEREHGSVFHYLISLDKRHTGLSDHQNKLLRLFYEGKSDAEVQKETGIGSSSTIRNHRFAMREKERQAKIYLALMELLRKRNDRAAAFVDAHPTATMVDDRYNVTQDEYAKSVRKLFPDGPQGRLKTFDVKEKHKLVALRELAKRFERGRTYNEKEINETLSEAYDDYATLRRYLIEYGFLDRTPDCSAYWVKSETKGEETTAMDRRKELNLQYKETGTEAGVFAIRNTVNGKRFVQGAYDLKKMNGKRFELQTGSSPLRELQSDWNLHGEQAFTFEILEKVDRSKLEGRDIKQVVEELEAKWLQKLQPYGENGYNRVQP